MPLLSPEVYVPTNMVSVSLVASFIDLTSLRDWQLVARMPIVQILTISFTIVCLLNVSTILQKYNNLLIFVF